MPTIPLNGGGTTLVDEEDYAHLLSYGTWSLHRSKNGHLYAYRWERIGRKQRRLFMHRAILNPQPWEIVDHYNGNSLDNRRINIRVCKPWENGQNSHTLKGKYLSPYLGIYFWRVRATSFPWKSEIRHARKRYHLGYYSMPEEAARAYDTAVRILYKGRGRMNFPDSHELVPEAVQRLLYPQLFVGRGPHRNGSGVLVGRLNRVSFDTYLVKEGSASNLYQGRP